jgi:hypothetical protein
MFTETNFCPSYFKDMKKVCEIITLNDTVDPN